ncbi:MAG TPA: FMN-binding glutamate synthase family protein, partial [Gemmatimonadales bacterium]|nr:FMN-binding glutamate synthase family protein [Gemmatimonadales bacterium]
DIIWQIGTGYFGCRNPDGSFSMERFLEQIERHPVRAVEIKLSQGAKPGVGGILPGAKVTPEIAAIRGVEPGVTCVSPSHHGAFSDVDSMLDFVEELAEASGLPVGIKSAVGEERFWHALARLMAEGRRGVDFITIDGGEGGTGAGPLTFTDHVSLPFWIAMSTVHRIFAGAGIADQVLWVGSGRLGIPARAALAMGLGCDMINLGRESMLSIGCIQAQLCHTGRCPTGVATHSPRLTRGLDPEVQAGHFSNYIVVLRQELLELSRACGVPHPAEFNLDHFDILDDRFGRRPAHEVFGY